MNISDTLMIPKVSSTELGLDNINVQVIEKQHVDGNISEKEIEIISKLVKKLQPKTIFEIGTFDGRTTINIARHVSDDAKIFTLDLPKEKVGKTKFNLYDGDDLSELSYADKDRSGLRYQGKEGSGKITQLYGDSATFDFSLYFGTIDFMFVDGSHAKDYVVNDTEIAFKLVRPGGTILWHDYGVWKDVMEVLDRYYDKDAQFKDAKDIGGTCFVVLGV